MHNYRGWLVASILALALNMDVLGQDPTKPVGYRQSEEKTVKKQLKKLVLHGVVAAKGEKVAIINDRILQLGDRVNGYKLIAIGENKATLRSEKKELTLYLVKASVIQRKTGTKND